MEGTVMPPLSNRRALHQLGMSKAGPEELWQSGIAVTPFMDPVAQEPQRLQPHYHAFYQIFLLKGRATVMQDFVEFPARGTTLVFLSPGQVHTVRPTPSLSGTSLSFTQEFFDHHTPPPSQLFEFPFFFTTDTRPWLSLPLRDPFRIEEVFTELQREFNAAQVGAGEVLRALLHILLVRANRFYAVAHPPKEASRAAVLMRQFHLAVEQHFRTIHSVPEYAQMLGITANHLHDVAREESGRSAGEVIRQRRMLDAKRLLLHSEASVSEIAYQLGFQDPSYFARAFKRDVGQSPVEFREGIREKHL
jgi:AraC family transcriptional activator of pobA